MSTIDFLYIADPEILAVPIQECHEPLVDVKAYNDLLYGPPPECEWTAPDYTKMRVTVYEKICAAQRELPRGMRFRLYEGFRSLKVQAMLFEQMQQQTQQRLPHATPAEIFHETTRLVSPVINADGTKNIPPHNTGAAIDIEILTADGELLDMGMTAKDWVSVEPELCLTNYPHVSTTVKANRKLLLDIMQAHGFVNYPTEWWHYSYGDRYWAYYSNAPHAIYGSL